MTSFHIDRATWLTGRFEVEWHGLVAEAGPKLLLYGVGVCQRRLRISRFPVAIEDTKDQRIYYFHFEILQCD